MKMTTLRSILLGTALCIVLGTVAYWFLARIQFAGWERMLRGPFMGVEVSDIRDSTKDSTLSMPRAHLLYVSNAYTNNAGDDWPVLVLMDPNDKVVWARILKPEINHPTTRKVETPYVRDVSLIGVRAGSRELKVVISCYWGAGGQEKGIIYIDKESFAFRGFAISW